jgi:hypothetical protein
MGAAGLGGAAALGGSAGGAGGGAAGGGAKGGAGAGGVAGAGLDGGMGGCSMTEGTLDFEDLATTQAFVPVSLPYVHAGFTLTTDDPEGIEAVGMKSTVYLNTTGLIANRTATITFTRTDGKPFSLLGIDLSPYNDVHPGIVYTFVGHKTDGSTISQDVSLRNSGAGFVPYTLPSSFDDLVSVSWSMNTADTALYFDNVRYSFCSGG